MIHPHAHNSGETKFSKAYSDSSYSTYRLETTGTLNLIVVPIQYSDVSLQITSNQIWSNFFGPQAPSVSNYFAAQSYGQLQMSGIVLPTVVLPTNRHYYATSTADDGELVLGQELIEEAMHTVTNALSMYSVGETGELFDNNDDNRIDAVVFYHAGQGAETSGGYGITSYAFNFDSLKASYYNALPSFSVNGFSFARYTIVGEVLNEGAINWKKRSAIGTICHELGHILGLGDLYNTSIGQTILGRGVLMDSGNYAISVTNLAYYNTVSDSTETLVGYYPAPFNAWHKQLLGWTEEQVLVNGLQDLEAHSLQSNVSYRIATKDPDQFYYLQYHHQSLSPYDEVMGTNGFALFLLDESILSTSPFSYYAQGLNNGFYKSFSIIPFNEDFYSEGLLPWNALWSAEDSRFSKDTSSFGLLNDNKLSGVEIEFQDIDTQFGTIILTNSTTGLDNVAENTRLFVDKKVLSTEDKSFNIYLQFIPSSFLSTIPTAFTLHMVDAGGKPVTGINANVSSKILDESYQYIIDMDLSEIDGGALQKGVYTVFLGDKLFTLGRVNVYVQ